MQQASRAFGGAASVAMPLGMRGGVMGGGATLPKFDTYPQSTHTGFIASLQQQQQQQPPPPPVSSGFNPTNVSFNIGKPESAIQSEAANSYAHSFLSEYYARLSSCLPAAAAMYTSNATRIWRDKAPADYYFHQPISGSVEEVAVGRDKIQHQLESSPLCSGLWTVSGMEVTLLSDPRFISVSVTVVKSPAIRFLQKFVVAMNYQSSPFVSGFCYWDGVIAYEVVSSQMENASAAPLSTTQNSHRRYGHDTAPFSRYPQNFGEPTAQYVPPPAAPPLPQLNLEQFTQQRRWPTSAASVEREKYFDQLTATVASILANSDSEVEATAAAPTAPQDASNDRKVSASSAESRDGSSSGSKCSDEMFLPPLHPLVEDEFACDWHCSSRKGAIVGGGRSLSNDEESDMDCDSDLLKRKSLASTPRTTASRGLYSSLGDSTCPTTPRSGQSTRPATPRSFGRTSLFDMLGSVSAEAESEALDSVLTRRGSDRFTLSPPLTHRSSCQGNSRQPSPPPPPPKDPSATTALAEGSTESKALRLDGDDQKLADEKQADEKQADQKQADEKPADPGAETSLSRLDSDCSVPATQWLDTHTRSFEPPVGAECNSSTVTRSNSVHVIHNTSPTCGVSDSADGLEQLAQLLESLQAVGHTSLPFDFTESGGGFSNSKIFDESQVPIEGGTSTAKNSTSAAVHEDPHSTAMLSLVCSLLLNETVAVPPVVNTPPLLDQNALFGFSGTKSQHVVPSNMMAASHGHADYAAEVASRVASLLAADTAVSGDSSDSAFGAIAEEFRAMEHPMMSDILAATHPPSRAASCADFSISRAPPPPPTSTTHNEVTQWSVAPSTSATRHHSPEVIPLALHSHSFGSGSGIFCSDSATRASAYESQRRGRMNSFVELERSRSETAAERTATAFPRLTLAAAEKSDSPFTACVSVPLDVLNDFDSSKGLSPSEATSAGSATNLMASGRDRSPIRAEDVSPNHSQPSTPRSRAADATPKSVSSPANSAQGSGPGSNPSLLNLNRGKPGAGGGPTFWGMWEDERDRMVYVSWLPRVARATDRLDKKKCELQIKQFIGSKLKFNGLEKVLLFPPSSAHCKLIFKSEYYAQLFLEAYGGLEGSRGPEDWKHVVCEEYDVDIKDGIEATKVKIIWADQTKNERNSVNDPPPPHTQQPRGGSSMMQLPNVPMAPIQLPQQQQQQHHRGGAHNALHAAPGVVAPTMPSVKSYPNVAQSKLGHSTPPAPLSQRASSARTSRSGSTTPRSTTPSSTPRSTNQSSTETLVGGVAPSSFSRSYGEARGLSDGKKGATNFADAVSTVERSRTPNSLTRGNNGRRQADNNMQDMSYVQTGVSRPLDYYRAAAAQPTAVALPVPPQQQAHSGLYSIAAGPTSSRQQYATTPNAWGGILAAVPRHHNAHHPAAAYAAYASQQPQHFYLVAAAHPSGM